MDNRDRVAKQATPLYPTIVDKCRNDDQRLELWGVRASFDCHATVQLPSGML